MKSGRIRLAEWKKQGRAVVRELLEPPAAEEGTGGARSDGAQLLLRRPGHGGADLAAALRAAHRGRAFSSRRGPRGRCPACWPCTTTAGSSTSAGARSRAPPGDASLPAGAPGALLRRGGLGQRAGRRGYGVLAHDVLPFGSRRIAGGRRPGPRGRPSAGRTRGGAGAHPRGAEAGAVPRRAGRAPRGARRAPGPLRGLRRPARGGAGPLPVRAGYHLPREWSWPRTWPPSGSWPPGRTWTRTAWAAAGCPAGACAPACWPGWTIRSTAR